MPTNVCHSVTPDNLNPNMLAFHNIDSPPVKLNGIAVFFTSKSCVAAGFGEHWSTPLALRGHTAIMAACCWQPGLMAAA